MSAPHDDDRALTPPGGDFDPEFQDREADELGALLRDRMEQAVAGLQPRSGTLEHLRRAVPARRRRRQAALATTAVTVLAVGTGAALAAHGSLHPSRPVQAGGGDVGNLMSAGTSGERGGGSGHGPGPIGGLPSRGGSSSAAGSSATASSVVSPSSSRTQTSNSPASQQDTGSPVPPACQNSAVQSVTRTQSSSTGGVTYETVIGTVKSACTVTGMPSLTAADASGALARVPQHKPDPTVAPLLPDVPAGRTLFLRPGDRFEFQFAWVPLACATSQPSTSATVSTTTVVSTTPTVLPTTPALSPSSATNPTPTQPTPTGSTSSSASAASSYSVSFSVFGAQAGQATGFVAACGAALYVTDYFAPDGQGAKTPTATAPR
ncbi:MAG: hypothetical protein JF587_04710 [Catenulisporales bacterium]|nr:hypothetical protein [Catenulisporales bacterium]